MSPSVPSVQILGAEPSEIAGTTSGPDPDAGKLFEVPRIKVVVDTTDPTVVKLAFSGSIELDRSNEQEMRFYNQLKAGQAHELVVTVHAAGAQMRHRRDSEGDVDAVVQTKSLVVSDVYLKLPEG
jgi:hypothetical protein